MRLFPEACWPEDCANQSGWLCQAAHQPGLSCNQRVRMHRYIALSTVKMHVD